jgi:hypothetical protein
MVKFGKSKGKKYNTNESGLMAYRERKRKRAMKKREKEKLKK